MSGAVDRCAELRASTPDMRLSAVAAFGDKESPKVFCLLYVFLPPFQAQVTPVNQSLQIQSQSGHVSYQTIQRWGLRPAPTPSLLFSILVAW